MNKTLLALGLGLALTAGAADAANVRLVNVDVAGVGLNETTPATPAGGNPGTTLGQQRTNAYQFAADLWGGVLKSNVDIRVNASFAPLTCDATSAVLGSAGPTYIFINGPGMVPNVIYPSALYDAIAGGDGVPGGPDISSQFNGKIGTPGCLESSGGWYYGLDGKTPVGKINFLNVVMHEIGHGLGVAGFLNKSTGALYAGYSDIYTRNAYDNVRGLRFDDPGMTNADRANAMKTPGRTVWAGANVNSQASLLLDQRRVLSVAAGPAAGNYELGYAVFGPAATSAAMPANQLVLVNDGVASPSATDGCEAPFVNAAAIAGKYAVIDRGTCSFKIKVRNAQLAGAVGVVIASNAAGVQDMGEDATVTQAITIPSVLVSNVDGATLKANLPLTAGIATPPGVLQGADNAGRVRLYAPTVVAGGSTFSHFDTALQPNALMEPFDTPSVQAQVLVDLTPALLQDLGWQLQTAGTKLGTCDTTVPGVKVGGLIPGSNVLGQAGVCKAIFPGSKASYAKCVMDRSLPLQQVGLISYLQRDQIFKCASLQP
ncbi:PA domain-containing protein [Lysobacter xanthus]